MKVRRSVGQERHGIAERADRLDHRPTHRPPARPQRQLTGAGRHQRRLHVASEVDPLDPAIALGPRLGQRLTERIAIGGQQELDPGPLGGRRATRRPADVRLDDHVAAGLGVALHLDVPDPAVGYAGEHPDRLIADRVVADLDAQAARTGLDRPLTDLPGDERDLWRRQPDRSRRWR